MSGASWVVYVLVSRASLATYVGVSNDAGRRLAQHNGARPGGAKTTRAGRPWRMAAIYGPYGTRAQAQRVEHAVKRRRGRDRLAMPGEPTVPVAGRRARLRSAS